MSSTARMDRARLEQFNRFWEELLQAVPDARRQAVEEAGAAVQRELNTQIGAAELAKMKPDAILINTARGPIVSQEALYNALKKGQIAGAAVDVYDQEPPLPLNLELFNAPNLLMLPHMGYATREAFETRLNIVIRNIEMWLNNTPQNQVL